LSEHYEYRPGSSASGIDFPEIEVDMKVTSINQPQSSCPFKSARQKIFGLGYHLIIFVYTKTDDETTRTGRLNIEHTIFVDKQRTADYQMTKGLREILANDGNEDDVVAFKLNVQISFGNRRNLVLSANVRSSAGLFPTLNTLISTLFRDPTFRFEESIIASAINEGETLFKDMTSSFIYDVYWKD
jgi:hypothetical protein